MLDDQLSPSDDDRSRLGFEELVVGCLEIAIWSSVFGGMRVDLEQTYLEQISANS